MKALYVPGADRTSQWFGGKFDGLHFPDLDKILLHSTETTGWPGYGGGGSAPTLTINPWTQKIRQHFVLNESSRSLVNPSSTPVSENKDKVCQIEYIGYSDAATARRIGRSDMDLRNLTDAQLRWMAGTLVFIMREWTVPNLWATPFPWPQYPASYGRTSSRMTSAQYDAFTGVLGHLHASGNTHGDPTLDVTKLRKFCADLLLPAKPPAPRPVPYPGHQHGDNLKDDSHVGLIQKRLKTLGHYKGAIDNKFGPATRSAVIAFQRKQVPKISADGYVGATTWSRLKITK